MKYLDPKADLTFKKVFGEHPELVKSLLNALLPFKSEEEEITSVTYLTPEMVPQTKIYHSGCEMRGCPGTSVYCRNANGLVCGV